VRLLLLTTVPFSCTVYLYILEVPLAIQTTYTNARQHLAALLDEVTRNREIVYIQGRRREKVAVVAAAELSGLLETAHLLRSPRNAQRLLAALQRALKMRPSPVTVEELRREVGLGPKKS
jgi:antitoxin YefM